MGRGVWSPFKVYLIHLFNIASPLFEILKRLLPHHRSPTLLTRDSEHGGRDLINLNFLSNFLSLQVQLIVKKYLNQLHTQDSKITRHYHLFTELPLFIEHHTSFLFLASFLETSSFKKKEGGFPPWQLLSVTIKEQAARLTLISK